MRLSDIFRLALANISRVKTRTILTGLSVCIGIASVVLIASIGDAGNMAVDIELSRLGIDGLSVYGGSGREAALLPDDASDIMAYIDGVQDAQYVKTLYGGFTMRNTSGDAVIWGVGAGMEHGMTVRLLHGRSPSETDVRTGNRVAVIDNTLAIDAYKRTNIVGKKIKLTVNGESDEYTITGVATSQKQGIESLIGGKLPAFVYIPYTCSAQPDSAGEIVQLSVKCVPGADIDKISEQIESLLNRKHGGDARFNVENMSGYVDNLKNIASIVTLVLSAVAAISLCVAGVGVMNTMLSSVSERRHEIGIYMAVGGRRRDVAFCFLMESAIICLIGGLAGALVGAGLAVPVFRLVGLTPILRWEYLLVAEGVSAVCGIFFGVIPAIRAAGMSPCESLRI